MNPFFSSTFQLDCEKQGGSKGERFKGEISEKVKKANK